MNKLIITEKPAVGAAYAALLGAKKRMDGYWEGNGYLVSWCLGHLVGLAGMESYDERYAKWNRADLPILPDPWQMKVAHSKKKQFETLRTLLHREDVSEVINACYHRTLNVGRVVSPTLALIVQRDAEIKAFRPESYYTAKLDFAEFSAISEKYPEKAEADKLLAACQGSSAVVTKVERTEKSEKAPALFDLATLQREANRTLGYTAQQTLDYLQSLYEKKLCTYPRTDSRFLTDDMAGAVKALVSCVAGICEETMPMSIRSGQVCDSRKVSDHHAVIPTKNAAELLRSGRTHIKNAYSERTGKSFDADLLLDDNGERTVYRFDFGQEAAP